MFATKMRTGELYDIPQKITQMGAVRDRLLNGVAVHR
jgi:hypothetical protein